VKHAPDPAMLDKRLSYYQVLEVREEVTDDGQVLRHMLHDNVLQGSIDVADRSMPAEFQRVWRILEMQRSNLELDDVLFIGGGTFGVPQQVSERWEDSRVTVLEIDQTVVNAAYDWFFLKEYPRIKVHTSDARLYLNKTSDKYDLVYLDAFSGWRSIPAHLTTQEFFQSIKEKLKPDAMVMMNLIAITDKPNSALFDAMLATIGSVFNDIQVYRSKHVSEGGVSNIYLIFGDTLINNDELIPIDEETGFFLSQLIRSRYE